MLAYVVFLGMRLNTKGTVVGVLFPISCASLVMLTYGRIPCFPLFLNFTTLLILTLFFFFTDLSSELFLSSDTGDSDTLHIRPSSPAPLEYAPVVDPTPIPTSALDTTLCHSTRIRDTPHRLTDYHCYYAIATVTP